MTDKISFNDSKEKTDSRAQTNSAALDEVHRERQLNGSPTAKARESANLPFPKLELTDDHKSGTRGLEARDKTISNGTIIDETKFNTESPKPRAIILDEFDRGAAEDSPAHLERDGKGERSLAPSAQQTKTAEGLPGVDGSHGGIVSALYEADGYDTIRVNLGSGPEGIYSDMQKLATRIENQAKRAFGPGDVVQISGGSDFRLFTADQLTKALKWDKPVDLDRIGSDPSYKKEIVEAMRQGAKDQSNPEHEDLEQAMKWNEAVDHLKSLGLEVVVAAGNLGEGSGNDGIKHIDLDYLEAIRLGSSEPFSDIGQIQAKSTIVDMYYDPEKHSFNIKGHPGTEADKDVTLTGDGLDLPTNKLGGFEAKNGGYPVVHEEGTSFAHFEIMAGHRRAALQEMKNHPQEWLDPDRRDAELLK